MGCEDEAVLSQTSDAVFRRGCCSRLVACLPMKAWAELASLLAWLFTGVSFVVTKQSFADASPLVFQALRFSIAFVTLLFLYRREGLRLVAHWRGVLVVGTFLTAGYCFQSAALLRTTPSRTAFLTALCVPLTPLFECLLLRALPRPMTVFSACLAAVGTFLLTGGSGGGWALGDWLMIGCASFFALHFLALNFFCREPAAYKTLAVGQMAVGTVLSWAVIPLDFTPFVHYSPYLIGGIIATGVLATAGSFALLSWAQQHVSAARTAIICATEPLFAALAALLILDEGMSATAVVGGALIVLSILVSEARFDFRGPPPAWLPRAGVAAWEGARAVQSTLRHASAPSAADNAAPADDDAAATRDFPTAGDAQSVPMPTIQRDVV